MTLPTSSSSSWLWFSLFSQKSTPLVAHQFFCASPSVVKKKTPPSSNQNMHLYPRHASRSGSLKGDLGVLWEDI